MNKLSTMVDKMFVAVAIILHSTLYTLHLSASPTANEDFVIAEDAKTFTNAVNAANAHTDAAIAAIPAPDYSTNNAELVATIAAKAKAPAGYATVSNRAMKAVQPLGPYALLLIRVGDGDEIVGGVPCERGSWGPAIVFSVEYDDVRYRVFAEAGEWFLLLDDYPPIKGAVNAWDFGEDDLLITFRDDLGATLCEFLAHNSMVARLADIPSTNDLASAAALRGVAQNVAENAGSISALSGQVATIGAHLNAEDARFVVTNYNSVTHTPEAYVEIKLPDESWSRIWSEMTRWTNFLGPAWNWSAWSGFHNWSTNVTAELSHKADRAWGFYDSTTGAYAPDGYTWISSEKIAIAANLAYQRTVTTEGSIWVLESNGTVTETGGLTNGFFRISDDEGNSLFEIVKGDKRTIGADASSCQVVAGFVPTKLQIAYSVTGPQPVIYVCSSLATQNWKAETDSDCIANVTWSGSSGAYVAEVQGKSAYSLLFVKATYEVGGETYISNAAPVSMQYIMIGGVKYAVGVGTVSGKTVLTLTAQ